MRRFVKEIIIFCVLFPICEMNLAVGEPLVVFPGKAMHQDSTIKKQALPDTKTTAIDSVQTPLDSLQKAPQKSSGLDTTLYYKAHIVNSKPEENKVYLIGKADVKYKIGRASCRERV